MIASKHHLDGAPWTPPQPVMSYLYPSQQALLQSFGHPLALRRPQGNNGRGPSSKMPAATRPSSSSPYMARPELYGAYSVVDDTKAKASKLGAEATKEFEKASATAQAKTGKIELYSAKYYAACTFGGLVACVSRSRISNGGSSKWQQQAAASGGPICAGEPAGSAHTDWLKKC